MALSLVKNIAHVWNKFSHRCLKGVPKVFGCWIRETVWVAFEGGADDLFGHVAGDDTLPENHGPDAQRNAQNGAESHQYPVLQYKFFC
jgi:hypothetical protein